MLFGVQSACVGSFKHKEPVWRSTQFLSLGQEHSFLAGYVSIGKVCSQQDSNLCKETPMGFQSIALTTQPRLLRQTQSTYNVLIATVQQSNSVIHIYVYVLFYIIFHILYGLSQDSECGSPVLCSRTLLFIHSIYDSLHLLIPNSQSLVHILCSFATKSLFSLSLSLFLSHK